MKRFLKNNATLIALFALIIIMAILSQLKLGTYTVFLQSANLSNIILQVIEIGIMAVGMTMVILIAGIDLSVGSIMALSAVVSALLLKAGFGVVLTLLFTLSGVGILLGLWNGFWISKYKIPPFIITLGMMTIARGLAHFISNKTAIGVSNTTFNAIGGNYIGRGLSITILVLAFFAIIYLILNENKQKKKYKIDTSRYNTIGKISALIAGISVAFYIFLGHEGIPISVVIFVSIILSGIFLLHHTKFGRRLYAIGGNEEAARLSGINIFKSKMIVFTIMTTLAALAGIISASRLGSASPNFGSLFELDAIAAVVIGGTSLTGGIGTIKGSIIGTFIIGILNNGLSLLGVSTEYQWMIKGLIIIMAVWFDVVNKRKKI